MKRILIVEDEPELQELLCAYLQDAGYAAAVSGDGAAALDLFRAQSFDLVLLDIMLPVMDGWSVCAKIRETSKVPIIMLTAKGEVFDRIQGLEMGADDYVVKPFGIMELQARVKAVLRRTGRPQTPAILKYDGLEIDPAAREVRRDGIPVELTYKEFELLKLLCENRGTVLTRDDILHAVWDYDFAGETRTVDMHVKTLRQKLGEGYIQTVRGVGYKMP